MQRLQATQNASKTSYRSWIGSVEEAGISKGRWINRWYFAGHKFCHQFTRSRAKPEAMTRKAGRKVESFQLSNLGDDRHGIGRGVNRSCPALGNLHRREGRIVGFEGSSGFIENGIDRLRTEYPDLPERRYLIKCPASSETSLVEEFLTKAKSQPLPVHQQSRQELIEEPK